MVGRNISVSSLMFLFLLSVVVVGDHEGCSPYSCGQIQSIRYPFPLKSEPIYCGDPNYKLTCNNNRTFVEIASSRYLVTNISYENSTIDIVSVCLGTCNCSCFPSLPTSSGTNRYYDFVGYSVTFVNCSKKIQKDEYTAVPCLSHNNRFVYVTPGTSVADIAPFCSFVSMFPTHYDMTSSEVDVFRALQEGFTLAWPPIPNRITRLKQHISICLHRAKLNHYWKDKKRHSILKWFHYLFQIEQDTLKCLRARILSDNGGNTYVFPSFMYRLIVLFIILIDIAAILSAIALLVRFILTPLAIYAFLAYKFWEMLVSIDSVEKFLQKHQALTPTRYSYTDIIAMTSHIKEKLGKGASDLFSKGSCQVAFLSLLRFSAIPKITERNSSAKYLPSAVFTTSMWLGWSGFVRTDQRGLWSTSSCLKVLSTSTSSLQIELTCSLRRRN